MCRNFILKYITRLRETTSKQLQYSQKKLKIYNKLILKKYNDKVVNP